MCRVRRRIALCGVDEAAPATGGLLPHVWGWFTKQMDGVGPGDLPSEIESLVRQWKPKGIMKWDAAQHNKGIPEFLPVTNLREVKMVVVSVCPWVSIGDETGIHRRDNGYDAHEPRMTLRNNLKMGLPCDNHYINEEHLNIGVKSRWRPDHEFLLVINSVGAVKLQTSWRPACCLYNGNRSRQCTSYLMFF